MNLKRTILLGLIFFLIGSIPLRAEENYLEKAYFGALYMGSLQNYYQFQNSLFPLIAVKTRFPFASGNLWARVMYDFQKPGAHFWWLKDLSSSIQFNVGYFPRPVAIINRPEPVSSDGNFEPPCKSVIPGLALGTLVRLKSKMNNEFMFGLYTTHKDSAEINFGVQQNVNLGALQKVGITGYCDSRKNFEGVVLNAEFKKLSLMFYSGRDQNLRIYSGSTWLVLGKNTGIYTCLLWIEKWQKAEIGFLKEFSEKVGGAEINYRLGISYDYSEVRPTRVNFYLQIWLGK